MCVRLALDVLDSWQNSIILGGNILPSSATSGARNGKNPRGSDELPKIWIQIQRMLLSSSGSFTQLRNRWKHAKALGSHVMWAARHCAMLWAIIFAFVNINLLCVFSYRGFFFFGQDIAFISLLFVDYRALNIHIIIYGSVIYIPFSNLFHFSI